MTRSDVLNFMTSHKEQFVNEFGVIRIGVFGSVARDEAGDTSDIDIAVELQRENKADNYFKLLHFLQDALHVKIDLGIESTLKEAVQQQIKKDIIYV